MNIMTLYNVDSVLYTWLHSKPHMLQALDRRVMDYSDSLLPACSLVWGLRCYRFNMI